MKEDVPLVPTLNALELLQSINASLLEGRSQGKTCKAFVLLIQPSIESPYPLHYVLSPQWEPEEEEAL